jgi:hypothetical protein
MFLSNSFKLALVNLFLLGSIIVSYFYGYIAPIFTNDISHISYVLAFLTLLNIFLSFIDSVKDEMTGKKRQSEIKRWLNFSYSIIIYAGLCGTLLGFSHLLGAINTSSNVETVIEVIKSGCTTLANTTLVGVVGFIWLNLIFYITKE